MGQAVASIGTQEFEQEVLKSDTAVLVDFWATWCGPCLRVAPILEEFAGEKTGKLKVVKVDIDEAQDLAIEYGVSSVPTFVVFKNGEEVDRMMGAGPKSQFEQLVSRHL